MEMCWNKVGMIFVKQDYLKEEYGNSLDVEFQWIRESQILRRMREEKINFY